MKYDWKVIGYDYPEFHSVARCPKCFTNVDSVKRMYVGCDVDVKIAGIFSKPQIVFKLDKMIGACPSCGYTWCEHTADYVEEGGGSSNE